MTLICGIDLFGLGMKDISLLFFGFLIDSTDDERETFRSVGFHIEIISRNCADNLLAICCLLEE